jgi:hypothetical protein
MQIRNDIRKLRYVIFWFAQAQENCPVCRDPLLTGTNLRQADNLAVIPNTKMLAHKKCLGHKDSKVGETLVKIRLNNLKKVVTELAKDGACCFCGEDLLEDGVLEITAHHNQEYSHESRRSSNPSENQTYLAHSLCHRVYHLKNRRTNPSSGPYSYEDFFEEQALTAARNPHHGSREVLVFMSPSEFLKLTPEVLDKNKEENLEKLIASKKPFNSLPSLKCESLPFGDLQVRGCEGRHRARALRARGIEKMPVVILSLDGNPPCYRWGLTPLRPRWVHGEKGAIPWPKEVKGNPQPSMNEALEGTV